AAHDKELTSTFGDIAYRSGVTVSSILGSAFAVSSGTFVTDASLLVGAKEVTLRTSAGRTAPARMAGLDLMIGVALLKCDLPEVPPLNVRSDRLPQPGESLSALGFPSSRAVTQSVLG